MIEIIDLPALNYLAQISGDIGQDMLDQTRTSQNLLRNTLDYQWDVFIGNNSHPLWLIFCTISRYISMILLGIFTYEIIKKLFDSDFQYTDLYDLRKPLIVIFFMADNGLVTSKLALALRNTIVNINYQVITKYESYHQAGQNFAKENPLLNNEEVRTELIKAQKACADLFEDMDLHRKCLEEELTKAQSKIDQSQNPGIFASLGNLIKGIANNTYDLITYGASSISLADDRLKLFASAVTFNIGADIALFYVALYAPIAMGSSLLPMAKNSFIVWLSAFYGIGMVQISYSVMTVMMSDILTNGRGLESYITAELMAKVIPALAVIFGTGGGFVMYSSFISMGLNFSQGLSFGKLIPKKGKR